MAFAFLSLIWVVKGALAIVLHQHFHAGAPLLRHSVRGRANSAKNQDASQRVPSFLPSTTILDLLSISSQPSCIGKTANPEIFVIIRRFANPISYDHRSAPPFSLATCLHQLASLRNDDCASGKILRKRDWRPKILTATTTISPIENFPSPCLPFGCTKARYVLI